MVEPYKFGPNEQLPPTLYGNRLHRRLRRMSKYPKQPRKFHQAHILVPVGLPASVIGFFFLANAIHIYRPGEDGLADIIVPSLISFSFFSILAIGLFRRYGVDEEKMWSSFGKIYYKEVRFEDIERWKPGAERYKFYTAKNMINIDYNRFDYTLASLQMLRVLKNRRIALDKVDVDDPNWEEKAQIIRNMFARDAYDNHTEYYNTHPEELAELNYLVQPPETPI